MVGIGLVVAAAGIVVVAGLLIGSSSAGPREDKLLSDWSKGVPPWPVFNIANALVRLLERLRDAILPPPIVGLELAFSYVKPQILYALAHFRIADHLASGPKTAAELAQLTGVKEARLWRVLRTAVAMRLLAGATDRRGVTRFFNNATSATLREDHPNCVKYMVTHQMEECYGAWGQLVPALEKGDAVPWDLWQPKEAVWDYFKARPESENRFSKAMLSVDNMGMASALADFDWSRYRRVIDVGGAYGSMLAAVMRANPGISGVLFDLPQVIDNAKAVWQEKNPDLLDRIEFVGGSFLESGNVPAAKSADDIFVLRGVLHDWNDAKTTTILKHIRAAIGTSGASLALIELTPQPKLENKDPFPVLMDMHMLVVCDGSERTKDQWQDMFQQTGFRLRKVHPMRGVLSAVEAGPA